MVSSPLPTDIESFRRQLADSGWQVVIVGAGVVSEALFYACREADIAVAGFCDNNYHKTMSPKCGLPVFHTPELPQHLPDALFLVGAADIQDVMQQLHGLGYEHIYPCTFMLRDYAVARHEHSAPHDFVDYAIATCLNCHDSYLDPNAVFIRSVDLIVTERCSLRCRDCSNLMQYYRNPVDCSMEELNQSLDGLLSLVDAVNEVRIIGGEPFMNRDVHRLVGRLAAEDKVGRIVIYTNGTIVPRVEQIGDLRSPKTLVLITDYGPLSKNLAALTRCLGEYGIQYHQVPASGWSACCRIARHNRSEEEQTALFTNCCAKNTYTLSNGRLYRCPFSANAARLEAIPDFRGDYVEMAPPLSVLEMPVRRLKLKRFLLHTRFLESCDYCAGRPFGAPAIPAGVQVSRPLKYQLCKGSTQL